jgi:penicillin-binding protein 1C
MPLLLLLAATSAHAFATFDEVKARYVRSEGVLLDRNGETLHESRTVQKGRRLEWTPLSLISQALKDAVVFSEDRKFASHSGVDWAALAKAAGENLFSRKKRGASTISMQVASFVESDLMAGAPLGHRRGIAEKVKQIQGALDLERSWSKDQILEAYLNFVSFRGELQGVAAASQGLFGKAPHGLGLEESLLLSALIRSPEALPAQVERRACELGKRMGALSDCAGLSLSLKPGLIRPEIALAPHVAQRYLSGAPGGAVIRTTIDRSLQAFVSDTLRRHVLAIRDRNVNDAAALVLDNESGDVLAYVGGLGELSSARHVDGVQARRQAGSTLKPILYGLAIESRYLTAASLIDDAPTDIPVLGGVYRPRNYDKEFHGKVSVRTALASSLNVPAVRTLALIGVDPFVRKLEHFGITGLESPEYYGPSLALGSADISLWDLTNAYRALANGGLYSQAHVLPAGAPGPGRRALSNEAAFIIGNILSDRESRNLTFGLENPLSSRFWTAAKTGTSKDMRDNWCVGFSRRYTVGVWVGNFSGKPMWNVTGISGAGPSWADIMNELHSHASSRAPEPPKGVVQAQGEWFIRGTFAPALAGAPAAEEAERGRITYPADGMIIARDPDIPPALERVFFEAKGLGKGAVFRLNDRVLGSASEAFSWRPGQAGRYELALVDAEGHALDVVHFRVRGNVRSAGDDEPESPAGYSEDER